MRPILAAVLVLTACGGSKKMGGDDTPPDADDGPAPAFAITSNDVTLQPGEEQTFCFYFHTSNTAPVNINKWVSDLAPGSHHIIFFSNLGNQPADGTVDDCGGGGAAGVPTYGTQIPHEEVDFPADDGTGKPLAQTIAAHTPGYFQMHYLNSTDAPLTAHVSLKAFALDAGTTFTPTAPYATYNNDISIPPHGENITVSATCNVPANAKFWSMSTHSHKQSVGTDVKDGSSMIFMSADWEHPGVKQFPGPTFYTFAAGKLTWECTYSNTGDNQNNTIVSGPSARTNEMCMATGYVFPATQTKGCIFSGGQCLCQL